MIANKSFQLFKKNTGFLVFLVSNKKKYTYKKMLRNNAAEQKYVVQHSCYTRLV